MGWKRKRLEALGDEDLYDIHLVGTDGEEVPCCKATLAMTSPVFKNMFYKGYREQKANQCTLNFHSLALSTIVKYCYCGEVDMDLIFSENRSLQEEASLLFELREAGRYFEIDDLSSTAEAKIGDLVFQQESIGGANKNYQYAAAFYTELFQRDEDDQPLGLVLLQFLTDNPMECFGPRALDNSSTETYLVPPNVLSHVLREIYVDCDEYSVVRCIQTWFSLESKSSESRYGDEDKRELVIIAENVDLKELSMQQLANIEPCSLFSSERIRKAFVHHCRNNDEVDVVVDAPRTKRLLYVTGAGIDDLNGFYMQGKEASGQKIDLFFKFIKHNGVSCRSVIHRSHAGNKWLISITMNTRPLIMPMTHELHEDSIRIHVYEELPCPSPLPTISSNQDPKIIPPFNSWKCVEGTGSVPFVACIYRQEPNPAQDN